MIIKRNKIKEDKRRKVGESVNVIKKEYNLISTIKNYIFYFLKQKESKNINNLIIRRMWLNFKEKN